MTRVIDRRRPRRQRGFALLIVLWWTALLALLGAQLVADGRLDLQRVSNVQSAATLEAAAEGALQEALFHVLDGSGQGWGVLDSVHTLAVPGGRAVVEVQNEAGKVGVNVASAKLLASLMVQVGAAPAEAASLADAMLDWHTATQRARPLGAKAPEYRRAGLAYAPPNADFETLDELGLVRGMTPELLARLAPFLSVYQRDDPDPALASPEVRRALIEARVLLPNAGAALDGEAVATAPVLLLLVRVDLTAGRRIVRRTVLRLSADAAKLPFQILDQS